MLARTPLADWQKRRLRGNQDTWLTKQANRIPEAKPKPRKINRDKRNHIIHSLAFVLKQGVLSPFEYEGSCRHGLRSQFIFQGWTWIDADTTACSLIALALRSMGAQRPSWLQGQPEYTLEGFAPVEHTHCARCGGRFSAEDMRNGWNRKYCSKSCSTAAGIAAERESGAKRGYAEYWAAMTIVGESKRIQRLTACKQCGTDFIPRDLVSGIKHCSRECADKSRFGKKYVMKNPRQPVDCKHCSKSFMPRQRGVVFCSKPCFYQSRRIGIPEKPCEWCSTTFQPKERNIRFCSYSCGRFSYFAQKREGKTAFYCEAAE